MLVAPHLVSWLFYELEYDKLSVDWTMAIERHPCITMEFREMLSIKAASLNQTEVDFVKEMHTAIQHNMDELQKENTSDVEEGTVETTSTHPKGKEDSQPEEGDSSNLHQSGSIPNDAVDEPGQGKEDTAAHDEDGTG